MREGGREDDIEGVMKECESEGEGIEKREEGNVVVVVVVVVGDMIVVEVGQ